MTKKTAPILQNFKNYSFFYVISRPPEEKKRRILSATESCFLDQGRYYNLH